MPHQISTAIRRVGRWITKCAVAAPKAVCSTVDRFFTGIASIAAGLACLLVVKYIILGPSAVALTLDLYGKVASLCVTLVKSWLSRIFV